MKPRNFPPNGHDIVTQDVEIAVSVLHLEVPMIGREPLVEHVGDFNFPIAHSETARRFFSTMACITLNVRSKERRGF